MPTPTADAGGATAEATGPAKTRPGKVIKRVSMCINGRIEGFRVVYEDGQASEWHGKSTEKETSFDLEADEYITHIWYAADEGTVQGLLFGTTNGRRSQWFGFEHGHFGLLHKRGSVLVDLGGSPLGGPKALKAQWETFLPPGETTKFKTRYDILHKRFLELRHAVGQLSDTSDGMKSIDTQESAKRFEILVQDVELLHDQEATRAKARVTANARRQSLLEDQLVLCGEDLKTVLKLLGDLLAKLRPFSGEFDTAVQTCQLDGEKLYKDFAELLDDVEKYRQKLKSVSDGLALDEKFWAGQVAQSTDDLTKDSQTLTEIMTAKGLKTPELEDDYESQQWGLHAWRAKIDEKATHDFTLHHAIASTQKSDSRLQFRRSQVAFLQISRDLLADLIKVLDALEIRATMQKLRDLIDGLHQHHPNQNTALKEAADLLQILKQAIAALEKAAAAKVASEFAKPVHGALDALLKNKSFVWGPVNSKVLLDVSKDLSA